MVESISCISQYLYVYLSMSIYLYQCLSLSMSIYVYLSLSMSIYLYVYVWIVVPAVEVREPRGLRTSSLPPAPGIDVSEAHRPHLLLATTV